MPGAHHYVGGADVDDFLADRCVVVAVHVVRHVPGRGGVGPFDTGDYAGCLALALGQLEGVRHRVSAWIDADRGIVGLDAACHGGRRRC